MEVWKDIPNELVKGYQASNLGNLRYVDPANGSIEEVPTHRWKGYVVAHLSRSKYPKIKFHVHRLIAMAFCDIDEKFEKHHYVPLDGVPYIVNHKNSNRSDNRSDNLEWCDHAYNIKHGYDSGQHSNNVPVTILDLECNKEIWFNTMRDLKQFFKVDAATLIRILHSHREVPYRGQYLITDVDEDRLMQQRTNIGKEVMVIDCVTGDGTITKSMTEAASLTGVHISTIRAKLDNIVSDRLKMAGGYLFCPPEDPFQPLPQFTKEEALRSRELYRQRFITGNALSDSVQIIGMDYSTGVITNYPSIRDMARITGFSYDLIYDRIQRKNERDPRNTPYNGCYFMSSDLDVEWPDFTPEEIRKSKDIYEESMKSGGGKTSNPSAWKRVFIKDLSTGVISEYKTIRMFCDEKNFKLQHVQNKIYNNPRRLYNGYQFMIEGRHNDWPEVSKEQIAASMVAV